MRVRLIVKLAEVVDGVDLSTSGEGDILDLSTRDASMLIAGGWAEVVTDPQLPKCEPPAVAADQSVRRSPARDLRRKPAGA